MHRLYIKMSLNMRNFVITFIKVFVQTLAEASDIHNVLTRNIHNMLM